jgi:hypothetical protein
MFSGSKLQITEVGNNAIIGWFEVVSYTTGAGSPTYTDITVQVIGADGLSSFTAGRTYSISYVVFGTTGADGTSGTRGTSGTSGLLLLSGNTDNGLITLSGSTPNATVESNLTFNGSTLAVTGTLSVAGRYQFTHQTITELSANGGLNASSISSANATLTGPAVLIKDVDITDYLQDA